MNSVLFSTDFSENSRLAFRFMRLFGQKMNAQLTILNAYLDSNSPRRPRLEEGTIHEQINKRLIRFVKSEYRNESAQNIRIRSDRGDPVHAIIDLSKNWSYDLVAMSGSKDFGWFAHILGSRTAKASRLAFSPVLIIPPTEQYDLPKNMMFIGNSGETNTLIISKLIRKITYTLDANIHVLPSPNLVYSLNESNNWLDTLRNRISLKSRKRHQSMMHRLQEKEIDMLVYRLESKNILEQLLDYYYVVQKALNKGIPVIVINDQAFQRLS